MKRQGVANVFHARCVILKKSVYSLFIAREGCGNRDAQCRNEKEIYFMLSNINSLESVGIDGTRGYG